MKNRKLTIAAIIAMVFGGLSILAGGFALFGGTATEAAVGDAVPFVLWFNFFAGVAYVVAGGGLLKRRRWGFWLSAAILAATLAVLAAFGVHVLRGGAFEMRTVGAMILRALVWMAIVAIGLRAKLHSD